MAFTTAAGALPGVEHVAIQQVARGLEHPLHSAGKPREPFTDRSLGTMATIGRNSAVADFGWLRVKGYLAWLMWLFPHVSRLIGFRSRLSVMPQWAFSYLTYQRSVRLITNDLDRRDEGR